MVNSGAILQKGTMRLFYNPQSSASLRVLLYLRCKGVPSSVVELVQVETNPAYREALGKYRTSAELMDGQPRVSVYILPEGDAEVKRLGTRDYLAFNCEGRVPVLQIKDTTQDGMRQLTQSSAILDWLEESLTGCLVQNSRGEYDNIPALLPEDAWQRAQVRQIINMIACDIHPLQNMPVVMEAISRYGMRDIDPQKHPFRVNFLRRGFESLEVLLSQTAGRFSMGDSLTQADVFLVPQVRNALGAGLDVAKDYPTVHRVWLNCLGQSSILTTLEECGGVVQQGVAVSRL